VFGTPPPFDTNVPKAKKPKAPPLLPPLASRALDLASANASRSSALGNVGGTAKRYLDNELADLRVAVKAIREKYDNSVGKVHTELFHALVSAQNKIRKVREQIKNAIKSDRLAEIQFAIDLAELTMASTKEGSAAYKRAELHEEKLLRSEISYLDKRVKNKKLSLSLREDALQQELSARQQLNTLLGNTSDIGKVGANQAQFLSSFQQIVHAYAPNAFPEPPSNAPLQTKGYETVDQLRRVNEKLERLVERTAFPASGYSAAAAEAAGA
jgi:Zn-dependent M16 (insulinase) family peptidase